MPQLSNEELLKFNQLGLIPGPDEHPQNFAERAAYCLRLKEFLSEELKTTFTASETGDPEVIASVASRMSEMYDIAPTWVPLFFSNHRLPFWHGGCVWIFQLSEESPKAVLIQLRRAFATSLNYLGIYQRNELLAHECVHIGRMAFEEPQFEEFFAYQTASSPFRKFFGPILQSSIESALFVLLLFVIVVFDFFLLSMGNLKAYAIAMGLKLIPIGLIVIALARLIRRKRCLNACYLKLEECLGSKEKARAAAYRLKDKEIAAFSTFSKEEILNYAHSQSGKELRWKVILMAYFQ